MAPTTTTRAPRLVRWVDRTLGEHTVVRRVDDGARAAVLEILDADGARCFAKRVVHERHWAAEVRAYRRWAPHTGDLMPTLRAANPRFHGLLVSAVPGEHPDSYDPAAHRAAGVALRRLQEAMPARPPAERGLLRPLRRVESVLAREPGLFTSEEAAFARRRVGELRDLPTMPLVPCHGDFKPHNWLVDDTGTLRLIDFAESRWDVPVADLCRLSLHKWWGRPHLVEEFLAGYGRRLEPHESSYIAAHLVTNAVVAVWFNHRHDRPDDLHDARARLHALMDGHQVVLSEPPYRRMARRVRSSARALLGGNRTPSP